jgi:hypothetical protein
MAHTASNSMNELAEELWPVCSPNLNHCDFYLWGTLQDNLHSLREFKENIWPKFLLFQDNKFAMCLKTFFPDVRPA